ncbi:FAD-binding oxidoreductase [Phytoactinopolyspora mesophila]|uniref:FAD-binding protein n=1 Tax=Phytoactinopolyspora mesophila TaxID=2650750 RepID=A0A7K3M0X9_9ACTN|nr:FAD-binding oxidoreductase [Phytoactinopolyspora mesophila]NDL56955.1 FAD-binding protein [Phytoactinopolyspora mesophila]
MSPESRTNDARKNDVPVTDDGSAHLVAASAAISELSAQHRPSDLAAARDAVVAAREADTNVIIHGGGTKLTWGARPDSTGRAWSAIDTRAMDALIHHEPGDMTAIVQAGIPLARLRAELAVAGQQLAVDPPRRGGGPTVGGAYIANDAGPLRFSYGGIRDLVIGTTTVLADGTISRSGGSVIKNVAGYDLNKLWCGSLGTLGLVVELIVRLHPLPEASRALRIPATAETASSFIADLLASPAECSVVEWTSVGGGVLLLGFEGRSDGLPARVDAVAALARRHGLSAELVDDADDDAAGDEDDTTGDDGSTTRGVLDHWREAHAGRPGDTVVRAATLPDRLGHVAAALDQAGHAAAGSSPGGADVESELHSHAGLGLHDLVLRGGDTAAQAVLVREWRRRVAALGGSVVVRERPPELDQHVDPWGQLGPARLLDLSEAVKRSVDPERRFAPGRFVGGL